MSLGDGGGGNPQAQEIVQQIEELEQHQAALEAEIEELQGQKLDIDDAIEAVENLESGATVQVPLGGGAYVRAKVADIDEVIVDLGADYSAERDQEGAVSSLESKQETLDDRIEELRSEIAEIETETDKLQSRAEELQAQQMQQLQQQQQRQQDE
ncbi:prefoldin subunit alpha [Halobacteriales archaeon QH_10_65_19]|nr:MAG: prefoldin subunit alpha [Halobacteriales archaeon QH_10_65_19]